MDRTVRAFIENEPEVMMRITALLKRKGYSMKKIVMETEPLMERAWLDITLLDCELTFGRALNTIEKVVDVHHVEEVLLNGHSSVHHIR